MLQPGSSTRLNKISLDIIWILEKVTVGHFDGHMAVETCIVTQKNPTKRTAPQRFINTITSDLRGKRFAWNRVRTL